LQQTVTGVALEVLQGTTVQYLVASPVCDLCSAHADI